MHNLASRKVLITGGSGFLGSHLAMKVADHGGLPITVDITPFPSDVSSDIKSSFGIDVVSYHVDITDAEHVNLLFNSLAEDGFMPDSIINNAAINPSIADTQGGRFESYPIESWNREIAVGLTGAFNVTQAFLRHALLSCTKGNVVNVSSDLGLIAPDHSIYNDPDLPSHEFSNFKPVTYSVVKSGLIGLTKYTATYAPHLIRSNAVCPAGIFNNHSDDFVSRLSRLIPLGRMASLDDVSALIIFLLSESSSYINGSSLSVDGGRTCW